ncbi:MAG: tyrosine-type recombinase/integrase [Gammaproteobacteria bacterium]
MGEALVRAGGGLEPPPAAADASEAVYARGVRYFTRWHEIMFGCAPVLPLATQVVHAFVRDHLAGLEPDIADILRAEKARKSPEKPSAVATVRTWLTSLSVAQASAGYTEKVVTEPIKLLLRRHARIQAHWHRRARTRPVTEDILGKLLETCEEGTLADLRDRAMLLVGIDSGGRRSSDLRDLRVENLERRGDDYLWVMPRSKTDAGTARDIYPITGRAADALGAWLGESGITSGPVFRGLRGQRANKGPMGRSTLYDMLKRRARIAGLDESLFSPHSLRYGFIAEASARGHSVFDIMRHTGHRTVGMVMHYANYQIHR